MRLGLSAIGLLLLPTWLAAQAYQCDISSPGFDGFVGNKYFVSLDRGAGSAAVYDYFIDQAYKAPLPVEAERRGNAAWILKWKIPGVQTANDGKVDLRYRARLDQATGKFTISGVLGPYDNNIQGSGTCKRIK